MSVSLAIPLAVSTILIIVIAKWAYQILQKLWVRPKKLEKHLRELGFDGNPYKFVYGDMKEFGKMRVEVKSKPIKLFDDIRPRVLPFHHQIIKKYGDNSFIWFGAKPRLNIMDPKLVKEIYSRPHEFHKPHPDPVADLVVGGLLAAHGKKWSKHRKIINPAFHLDKLKSMVPAISLSCDYMIKKWDALVPKNGSAEIDVWPYFEDLSGDMIARAAFGSNIEEGRTIFQLHKEQTDLGYKMMGSSYAAPFRPSFLPPKIDERMIQIENEIQAIIKKIIHKRENGTKTGQGNVDDLLSILLRANSKDIQQDDEEMKLSMEEVLDECKVFYTAGANSTSRLVVWTMIMLSAHPDWQTRAREEVLQVLGNNKKLDFESLNQLKTVTMILKEVLRLYPPTSMAIRAVSKPTKLGNITIPPWVQLTLPIILHQYDPRTWGNDATQFKPERFSEGAKVPSSFSPFSGGPRICIGHNFAMLEAKIAIATMLQHFSFELSTSYVHAPELFFLLRPQYGAKLVLQKLN